MGTFRFELRGFEKIQETFDKFAKRYPDRIATEGEIAGREAARMATTLAKGDTGLLRSATKPIFRRGASRSKGTMEIGVGVVGSGGPTGDRVRAAGAYEFGAAYGDKAPPIHKLMPWARRHGARGDGFQMARAISRNIKKRGIHKTEWMSRSVRFAMKRFEKAMADAIQGAF